MFFFFNLNPLTLKTFRIFHCFVLLFSYSPELRGDKLFISKMSDLGVSVDFIWKFKNKKAYTTANTSAIYECEN